ncbi:ABC-type multidrug transport system ATPase subunit [Peribacillus frigoritolerans]|uniref:ABC transporter ATP-binding protein n=1 Tax=Peribacillus TaxID=2675229 RepID=UPI00209DF026|nr:ABC transporter ATP-binding protein [Peribacillus frigoritolerans]MCP1493271.1 ABC-type multidrug transport system ATPase subunit [Peribacillus frigoritolerans]
MKTIEVNNLSKKYKNTSALNDINLEINKGRVVGLLGKNGAGKTTLNKLITGLIFPSAGSIKVLGEVPKGGQKKVGFLSENIALYPKLSARENLEISILQEGNSPKRDQISKILKTVSIQDTRKKANDFSLGMKRRLQVAMTVLANDRELLILDEPTNGLDLDGVLWLKNMILELKNQGKTILLSSHSILQMEDVLTDYIILNKGILADSGEITTLNEGILNIEIRVEDIEKAKAALVKKGYLYNQHDTLLVIPLRVEYMHYLRVLNEEDIYPISYNLKKKSLVDRFHQYAGGDNDD